MMLADLDPTIAVALGGAIGSILTGLVAAAAPWRSASTEALDKALSWQKDRIGHQDAVIERQTVEIRRISEQQERCERERVEDREKSAAAEARNLGRIEALEAELRSIREQAPISDTT